MGLSLVERSLFSSLLFSSLALNWIQLLEGFMIIQTSFALDLNWFFWVKVLTWFRLEWIVLVFRVWTQ
jgi:hypothetical protein